MLFVDRLIVPAMRGKGKMDNTRIYRSIKSRAKYANLRLSPTWKATVRNTLQRYSLQSGKFVGDYHFKHHGRGVWECRD